MEGVRRCIPRGFAVHIEAVKLIHRREHILIRAAGTEGADLLRLAEGVDHEIQIVNMQVEGHQTASAFVLHPVIPAPFRAAAEARHRAGGHMSQTRHATGKQLAVAAAVVDFLQINIFRPEAQHLRHHEADVVPLRRFI